MCTVRVFQVVWASEIVWLQIGFCFKSQFDNYRSVDEGSIVVMEEMQKHSTL